MSASAGLNLCARPDPATTTCACCEMPVTRQRLFAELVFWRTACMRCCSLAAAARWKRPRRFGRGLFDIFCVIFVHIASACLVVFFWGHSAPRCCRLLARRAKPLRLCQDGNSRSRTRPPREVSFGPLPAFLFVLGLREGVDVSAEEKKAALEPRRPAQMRAPVACPSTRPDVSRRRPPYTPTCGRAAEWLWFSPLAAPGYATTLWPPELRRVIGHSLICSHLFLRSGHSVRRWTRRLRARRVGKRGRRKETGLFMLWIVTGDNQNTEQDLPMSPFQSNSALNAERTSLQPCKLNQKASYIRKPIA